MWCLILSNNTTFRFLHPLSVHWIPRHSIFRNSVWNWMFEVLFDKATATDKLPWCEFGCKTFGTWKLHLPLAHFIITPMVAAFPCSKNVCEIGSAKVFSHLFFLVCSCNMIWFWSHSWLVLTPNKRIESQLFESQFSLSRLCSASWLRFIKIFSSFYKKKIITKRTGKDPLDFFPHLCAYINMYLCFLKATSEHYSVLRA